MKRIISLVLALSMVLSMFPVAFAGTGLKDINGTKYEAAVEALMELGVVSGYPNGTYLPENVVTRAELAKLLVVAYGLLPAAEASKGLTPFGDVNAEGANYWAAGYINVAADYKFINGYPDGTFGGNATVTYAEAITMCLRVLGYANEVEAKGTWPTNYIAKAQDLKLTKNVDFKSYNDGATRGNIALLIWNMLKLPMWEVSSESEGDGLVSMANRKMIKVKFPDYAYYDELTFSTFEIEYDSKEEEVKVMVTLSGDEGAGEYEYAKNDFYTFVEGTAVEALVNTEDGILLTMVPTSDNKLVEGTVDEINDKYDLTAEGADYVYARVEGKAIADRTDLVVESEYIYKSEVKKDKLKLNTKTYDLDDAAEVLFLRDGERITADEIEAGDIVSRVVANGEGFFVVGGTEAEGKLTRVYDKDLENIDNETVLVMVVDGDEYVIDETSAKYVEDAEEEADKAGKDFTDDSDFVSGMKNEEVVLKLDPVLGKVVRVEFDGNIGTTTDTDIKLFVATSEVNYENRKYVITLENEDGSDDYTFANKELGRGLYLAENTSVEGTPLFVELDEDDEILMFYPVEGTVEYGSGEDEEYRVVPVADASYNKEAKTFGGEFVAGSTVVITITTENAGKKNESKTVTFEEGRSAVEGLKNENAIFVFDEASESKAPIYVILADVEEASDLRVAILESLKENKIGELEARLDGDDELALVADEDETAVRTYVDGIVVYTTKTNKDDELEFTLEAGLSADALVSGETAMGYVSKIDGDLITVGNVTSDMTSDAFADAYDIAEMYVIVYVSEGEDFDDAAKAGYGQYVIDSFEVVDFEDVTFEEFDRITDDELNSNSSACVMFVVRGMAEIEE